MSFPLLSQESRGSVYSVAWHPRVRGASPARAHRQPRPEDRRASPGAGKGNSSTLVSVQQYGGRNGGQLCHFQLLGMRCEGRGQHGEKSDPSGFRIRICKGAHMLASEIKTKPVLYLEKRHEQKTYMLSNPEIEMIMDESRLSPTVEENQVVYQLFKLMTYQHMLLLSIYLAG